MCSHTFRNCLICDYLHASGAGYFHAVMNRGDGDLNLSTPQCICRRYKNKQLALQRNCDIRILLSLSLSLSIYIYAFSAALAYDGDSLNFL